MKNEMNKKRAFWAACAVEGFVVAKGEVMDGEWETEISDLISDLLHLAKKKRINTDRLVAHAVRMFQDEVHDKE